MKATLWATVIAAGTGTLYLGSLPFRGDDTSGGGRGREAAAHAGGGRGHGHGQRGRAADRACEHRDSRGCEKGGRAAIQCPHCGKSITLRTEPASGRGRCDASDRDCGRGRDSVHENARGGGHGHGRGGRRGCRNETH